MTCACSYRQRIAYERISYRQRGFLGARHFIAHVSIPRRQACVLSRCMSFTSRSGSVNTRLALFPYALKCTFYPLVKLVFFDFRALNNYGRRKPTNTMQCYTTIPKFECTQFGIFFHRQYLYLALSHILCKNVAMCPLA